jgi:hypothetical protein
MADDQIKVDVTADAEGIQSGMDEAVGALGDLQPAVDAAKEALSSYGDVLGNIGEIAAGVFWEGAMAFFGLV